MYFKQRLERDEYDGSLQIGITELNIKNQFWHLEFLNATQSIKYQNSMSPQERI